MSKERELLARVLTSELWSVQEELQAEIRELLAQPEQETKLRDHFAGLAMQGLLAADADRERWNARDYANSAYEQADAMIKARKGEE
jgi:hypothetical protein